jgi:dihydrofolate reductase
MRSLKTIAALSENRVIGAAGKIPWHLPEDFRWFKRATMGQILIMGRRTFESIGRPLPGRETIVLSRSGFSAAGIRVVRDLEELESAIEGDPREVWVAGGTEIYRQLLPKTSDLYLTWVHRLVDGDAVFPPFEEQFTELEVVLNAPEFTVRHYVARNRLLA